MTVTVLTGRALNNQPFLITSGQSSGGTDVAPAGTLTIGVPSMSSTGASFTFGPLSTGTNLRYKVQYKLHSSGSFTDGPVTTGSPAIVGGLTAATLYDFQLVAFNNNSSGTTVTSNAQPGTTLAGSASAPLLTDIVITQATPVTSGAADFFTYVGWLDTVGGVGPFNWLMISETWGGTVHSSPFTWSYSIWSDMTDFYGFPLNKRPVVRIESARLIANQVDSIRVRCTDARGTVVEKDIPIVKTTSDSIWMNFRMPVDTSSYDDYYKTPVLSVQAAGPSWPTGGSTLDEAPHDIDTNAPSTVWYTNQYNQLQPTTPPPARTYNLRVQIKNNSTNAIVPYDLQIVMTDVANYPKHMELVNGISVNTAMPAQTKIGNIACTTPGNFPVFSIIDSNNMFGIDPTSGELFLIGTPVAQDYGFQVKVTDRTFMHTDAFTITVVQGTALPANNITMSVAQNLTNWFYSAETIARPVGTPSITGMSGTPTWRISDQQRKNYYMDVSSTAYWPSNEEARGGLSSDQSHWNGYQRIQCDPSTGHVFVMAHLSPTDGVTGEWFELTATSGTQVCTKRFYLPVSEVVGPTYHVGQGMSTGAPGGTTGFEHLAGFLALPGIVEGEGDLGANAGATVYIHWNADPNYYANDVIQDYYTYRRGINGPLKFIGVAGPQGQLPRLGDVVGASHTFGYSDKAYFCTNNGDFLFRNLELSYCHMGVFAGDFIPAGNSQMSLVRQNSGKSGDIWIDNCDIHDADVPIHTGNTDGAIKITNTRIYNGAGCTSGAGANQHNLYLGTHTNMTVDNIITLNPADGHAFKCRAQVGTITNSRFFDSERGSQFNAFDLCQGGDYTITNCVFEKAAQSQNPYLIQFNEEGNDAGASGDIFVTKQLVINDSIFLVHAPLSYCDHIMSMQPTRNTKTGHYSSVALNNVQIIGLAGTGLSGVMNYFTSDGYPTLDGHDYTPTLTNVTYNTTTFPAMDFTTPCTYDCGRPGWHDSVGDLNYRNNAFPYFMARQMDPGVDEIRIAANAAQGTVICTVVAYGARNWSLSELGDADPNINPWATGATWSFGQTNSRYTGSPWGWDNFVHANRYTIDANTGQLKVGSAGLGGTGCDKVLLRATARTDSALGAASGKIVENAFFIVKT